MVYYQTASSCLWTSSHVTLAPRERLMTQILKSCAIMKDCTSDLLDLSLLFPAAPWVSHVTLAARERVMTQILKSCAIMKDCTSELLDLSLLFPAAPWVSHVTLAIRERLMTQILKSCAIMKDCTSELLDLSLLFPVAPWVSHVTCCQREADDSYAQFMWKTAPVNYLSLLFPAASRVCMFMFCAKWESVQFRNCPAQSGNSHFVGRSRNSYFVQSNSRIARAQSGNRDKVRISICCIRN